ncbi:MAG: hypothetical protein EOM20_10795 [Spartobacteria bacterium]|nr:hypothetical protein [Spartobacteria bacterium]
MSIQTTLFLASADGLEALVWLIVGILALVSQGVNKWKKNRDLEDIAKPPAPKPPSAPPKKPREYPQRRQGPEPAPAVDMENQLEDFLRQLTNQPPRKPAPQRMAPPPPPPVHRTSTPPPLTRVPGQRPRRPQPKPALPDMAPYAALPDIRPVRDLDYDVDAGRVAKVAPAKSVTSGLQFKIKPIKSTTSSNFSMTSSRRVVQSRFRPRWEHRDDIRRAMIGHIILGTPKGME